MWFKSARFYTVNYAALSEAFAGSDSLEQTLAQAAFRPTGPDELMTEGFAPLFPDTEVLSFQNGGSIYMRYMEENKLLPASVVRLYFSEALREKETELGHALGRQERDALKEAVTTKLLAQAFAVRHDFLIWCSPARGMCAIGASSAKRADRAMALLREAFGTFPASVLQPRCAVEERMTSWITQQALPDAFELGTDTVMVSSTDEGGVIRASKEDLTSAEITSHLEAGKTVSELQLTYNDSLSLVLCADLAVKRLRPLDQYLERSLPERIDDAAADLQSHLILQGQLLGELGSLLVSVFDCEQDTKS